jgi:hypothetical protein
LRPGILPWSCSQRSRRRSSSRKQQEGTRTQEGQKASQQQQIVEMATSSAALWSVNITKICVCVSNNDFYLWQRSETI